MAAYGRGATPNLTASAPLFNARILLASKFQFLAPNLLTAHCSLLTDYCAAVGVATLFNARRSNTFPQGPCAATG